ncbi:unnamed protein product [Ectocarpus sp. 6 AP-2014]
MAPAEFRPEDERARFACRGTLQGNPHRSGRNGWTPSSGETRETRDRENGGGVIARFTPALPLIASCRERKGRKTSRSCLFAAPCLLFLGGAREIGVLLLRKCARLVERGGVGARPLFPRWLLMLSFSSAVVAIERAAVGEGGEACSAFFSPSLHLVPFFLFSGPAAWVAGQFWRFWM